MTNPSSPPAVARALVPSGRTALVTGATSGIGAATARRLAQLGLRVVVSGRDAGRGAAVVDQIRSAGGEAMFAAVDLTAAPDELRRYAREVDELFDQPIDVLVLNAASAAVRPTPQLSDEDVELMLSTNLRASQVLFATLAPSMADHGRGVVIVVGSWMGQVGTSGGAFYGATKAAQEQLVRSWAAEFGPVGVRVNAVTPGMTLTDNNRRHLEVLEHAAASTPAQALVDPDDVADAIAFLASEAARSIHGATIPVDGGIARSRG